MDFRSRYSETFRFELGPWIAWTVPAALAGAAFALAAAPAWTRRYRWGVSLSVGLVPILLLAQTVYFVTEGISGGNEPSISWLSRPYWYVDTGPQFVLAALVGVALGLGFAGSGPAPPDEGSSAEAGEEIDSSG
jgi:hypothetical protein